VRDRTSFDEYVTARSPHLLRLAYLLARDWQLAEDLLQTALVQVSTHLSWRRRRWIGEIATGNLPDHPVGPHTPDGTDAVDERDELWRRLGELSPRQRAVLVLRFFEDLSDEQIAGVLGISVGGVRSQASRALSRLREVVDRQPLHRR
jgi:DNA-directed RNA polymerase specialized sigma24 family protein